MSYELIVCGTGFASSFFLHKWLQKRPASRVLVLERGPREDHAEQVARQSNTTVDSSALFAKSGLGGKDWLFTVGLGGGSNCWWAQTPRMWEEDFELKSRYGVGFDWPIGYADLEPYYDEAEFLMQVAGPHEAPYPRKGPCPQPPHKLSGFDQAMIAAFPGLWTAAPTGRTSLGTSLRSVCCANGVCGICPVDAKFRVMNELAVLYEETPNVTLKTEAEVLAVEIEAGQARGVRWRENGREQTVRADLVFLGMNAIFNPHVLAKSGDTSPLLGRRLIEQSSLKIMVDFEDVSGFDGGTHITGLGYMFYGGEQRRDRASCIIENYNVPSLLRSEKGKWRSRAVMKITAENLPEDRNRVISDDPDKPVAHFEDHSDYAKRALAEVPGEFVAMLDRVSPVEAVHLDSEYAASEGHIQGTTVMSADPEHGVVDATLRHHRIGNLLIGGAGAFPTSPCANPSLSISALSLRSADLLA